MSIKLRRSYTHLEREMRLFFFFVFLCTVAEAKSIWKDGGCYIASSRVLLSNPPQIIRTLSPNIKTQEECISRRTMEEIHRRHFIADVDECSDCLAHCPYDDIRRYRWVERCMMDRWKVLDAEHECIDQEKGECLVPNGAVFLSYPPQFQYSAVRSTCKECLLETQKARMKFARQYDEPSWWRMKWSRRG